MSMSLSSAALGAAAPPSGEEVHGDSRRVPVLPCHWVEQDKTPLNGSIASYTDVPVRLIGYIALIYSTCIKFWRVSPPVIPPACTEDSHGD